MEFVIRVELPHVFIVPAFGLPGQGASCPNPVKVLPDKLIVISLLESIFSMESVIPEAPTIGQSAGFIVSFDVLGAVIVKLTFIE